MNSEIINELTWRYATKKFDHSKKISSADLNTLLNVLRYTPSSYGMQPLKFMVVTNPEVRLKLQNASFNQSQVTEASHLIVICAQIETSPNHIDEMTELMSTTRSIEIEKLQGFNNYVKGALKNLSEQEMLLWNSKQAYIALGMFLSNCARLRIDSTPMEGFEPDKYDETLGLTQKGLKAVLVCPIGYRSEEDHYSRLEKVRKPLETLVEFV
jgi:nitroreductase / dihydropteridine reductase